MGIVRYIAYGLEYKTILSLELFRLCEILMIVRSTDREPWYINLRELWPIVVLNSNAKSLEC